MYGVNTAELLDQQVDARASRPNVGLAQRHLLSNDRSEVVVERERELLDVAPGRVRVCQRDADVGLWPKHARGEEME